MSLQLLAARIGIPVALGAVVGGVGLYMAVDAVCKSFNQSPWTAGIVGALAGAGGGFFVSQVLLR